MKADKKDDNPFRYCGEYYDKETEEIYLRARYYQPSVGRFFTRDTYTGEDDDPLSLHLYTYCENDGVNIIDPSGHKKVKVTTLGPETVYKFSKVRGYFYTSKMDVCTDGVSIDDAKSRLQRNIIKGDDKHQDGTAIGVSWKQTKKER